MLLVVFQAMRMICLDQRTLPVAGVTLLFAVMSLPFTGVRVALM